MKSTLKMVMGAMLAASVLMAPFSSAQAAGNPRDQGRAIYAEKIKGKKVVWVPIFLGVLESEWTKVMQEQFSRYGMEFLTRDSNYSNDVQLQTVTALINEKPDVLIVQNASTTLLTSEIKRAMEMGIYVVQVNQGSLAASDAYVGVDWGDIGKQVATKMVKDCGNAENPGKVALIQGMATAAASADLLRGAMEVLENEKSVNVVMSQPADWDANKANQLATTVLQQHPDLCGIFGFWGPMTAGAAEAVKTAGLQGKVKVYVTSDGQRVDCDVADAGMFTDMMSYRADVQGQTIVDAVLTLLQNGDAPGTRNYYYFSNPYWVKDKKDSAAYCYADPTK